jgi:methylenetetrahydrofolate dehydrogenase (NADP+)/methenyltetrahydrofolate cyclohydrolase
MIIDGKTIAESVYAELTPFFVEHTARLGIVVVGESPVIDSFVRIKARAAERLGIEMPRRNLGESASTSDVIDAARTLAEECDAIIVQLPLPKQVDTNAVLSDIAPEKDVDALNPRHSGEHIVDAPVALAVMEILKRSGVELTGKCAVVVGAGRLVGKPSAELLRREGAEVRMVTLEEGSIDDLKNADIIVSGAGQPCLIKPEHLKEGVALIDAGTSELNKKITGDAHPSCAQIASIFTPVPGGIGPVAVAMIFRNLKTLIERHG